MYQRVDIEGGNTLEGFEYHNKDGESEYVHIDGRNCDVITVADSGAATIAIYTKDIPKLIKALQAAEQYWKERE